MSQAIGLMDAGQDTSGVKAAATGAPRQKVLAAAGGSGVATAAVVLLTYVLSSAGITFPSNVQDAVSTIVVAALTFLAGYLCPPGASETSIRDSGGAMKSAVKA